MAALRACRAATQSRCCCGPLRLPGAARTTRGRRRRAMRVAGAVGGSTPEGLISARRKRLPPRATDDAVDANRRADERGVPGGAYNLGVLLEERGDLEGAEAAYRRADEREVPAGAFNLGRCWQSGGISRAPRPPTGAPTSARIPPARPTSGCCSRSGGISRAPTPTCAPTSARHPPAATRLRGARRGAGGSREGPRPRPARRPARSPRRRVQPRGAVGRAGDLEGAEAAYRRADERAHPAGASNLGVLLRSGGISRAPRPPTGAPTSAEIPPARPTSGCCSRSGGISRAPRPPTGAPTSAESPPGVQPRGAVGRAGGSQRRRGRLPARRRARASRRRVEPRVLLAKRGDLKGAEAAYRRAAPTPRINTSQHSHATCSAERTPDREGRPVVRRRPDSSSNWILGTSSPA